jgi:hypothetical protein
MGRPRAAPRCPRPIRVFPSPQAARPALGKARGPLAYLWEGVGSQQTYLLRREDRYRIFGRDGDVVRPCVFLPLHAPAELHANISTCARESDSSR